MTVREIVKAYLKKHGYDGLAGDGGGDGCGCSMDELICCDESGAECVPAKRVVCAPGTCGIRQNCCAEAPGQDCFQPPT